MIPDFTGDFLNFKGTKDGEQFVILSEGAYVPSVALKKDMFELSVEHNGKKKIWSPNNAAGQKLQDAYGMDTKEWVGKVVEIIHESDKMLIRPILSKK